MKVPSTLGQRYRERFGDYGLAWVAALPMLAADLQRQWRLRLDGPAVAGNIALAQPVRDHHGAAAVLKLQPVDDETCGEPIALQAWSGNGAARLLRHDLASGAMLLEALDSGRTLHALDAESAAYELARLLARLSRVPAPPQLRRLGDIAAELFDHAPAVIARLGDTAHRRLASRCADRMQELSDEPGDRLLHWDLHYGNVLAGRREPWLAIDPKPLAGDPGFELLPGLRNRWSDLVDSGDVAHAVRRRFDMMIEILELDRERAVGWTLARVLQNACADVDAGARKLDPRLEAVAAALSRR